MSAVRAHTATHRLPHPESPQTRPRPATRDREKKRGKPANERRPPNASSRARPPPTGRRPSPNSPWPTPTESSPTCEHRPTPYTETLTGSLRKAALATASLCTPGMPKHRRLGLARSAAAREGYLAVGFVWTNGLGSRSLTTAEPSIQTVAAHPLGRALPRPCLLVSIGRYAAPSGWFPCSSSSAGHPPHQMSRSGSRPSGAQSTLNRSRHCLSAAVRP